MHAPFLPDRNAAAQSPSLRSFLAEVPDDDVLRISEPMELDYLPTALILELEKRRRTPVVIIERPIGFDTLVTTPLDMSLNDTPCVSCGRCAETCPTGALMPKPRVLQKYEVDESRCILCGICVDACPYDALRDGADFELAHASRQEPTIDLMALAMIDRDTEMTYIRRERDWLDRARADREQLRLYEDRSRIAIEMNDHVVRQLFAVGMGLEGLMEALDDMELRGRVNGYVAALDDSIRGIRETIYRMQED